MVVPSLTDEQAMQKVGCSQCHSHFVTDAATNAVTDAVTVWLCCPSTSKSLGDDLLDCLSLVQFTKGFEKASLPSGKGYVRLTPDPSVT